MFASGAPLAAHAASATTTDASDPNAGIEAEVDAAFADAPVMIAVARCESRYRQFAPDGTPLDGGSGGMIGIFQINAAVHADVARSLGMDIDTAAGNIAYAKYLYGQEGTAPWLASSACWNPASLLDHDLTEGDAGPAVALAQELLNEGGFTVAAEGPGAPGNESDTYGVLTETAVERFQCARDIVCTGTPETTGYGMIGPKTRAALLAVGIS